MTIMTKGSFNQFFRLKIKYIRQVFLWECHSG